MSQSAARLSLRPPKAAGAPGQQFVLVINFGDHEQRISAMVVEDANSSPAGRTIEGSAVLPAMVAATDVPDLDVPGEDAEFDEDA